MSSTMQFGPSFLRNGPLRPDPPPSNVESLPQRQQQQQQQQHPTFSSVLAAHDAQAFEAGKSAQDLDYRSSGPFRYSRELMLSLWNESATTNLPIEMSANFHDIATTSTSNGPPLASIPLNEKEKKLFSTPLNSERRTLVQKNPDGSLSSTRSSLNNNNNTNSPNNNNINNSNNNPSSTSSRMPKRMPGSMSSLSGSAGFQGGVLGGVNPGSRRRREPSAQNEPPASNTTTTTSPSTRQQQQGRPSTDLDPWPRDKLKDKPTSRDPAAENWRNAQSDKAESVKNETDLDPNVSINTDSDLGTFSNHNQNNNNNDDQFDPNDPASLLRSKDAKNMSEQELANTMQYLLQIAGKRSSENSNNNNQQQNALTSLASSLLNNSTAASDPSQQQQFITQHQQQLQQHDDPSLRAIGSLPLDNPDDDILLRARPNSSSLNSSVPSITPPAFSPLPQEQPQQPQEDLSNSLWHYKDPSGQIQGPFVAPQMQEWFRLNYFTHDLLVKRAQSPTFEPLGLLLRKVTDPRNPFTSPLLAPAHPPPPPGMSHSPSQSAPPSKPPSVSLNDPSDPWSISSPSSSTNLHASQNLQPSRQFTTAYDPFSQDSQQQLPLAHQQQQQQQQQQHLHPQYPAFNDSIVGQSNTSVAPWSSVPSWDNSSSLPQHSDLGVAHHPLPPANNNGNNNNTNTNTKNNNNAPHPSSSSSSVFESYGASLGPTGSSFDLNQHTHSHSPSSSSSIPPIGQNPWNQQQQQQLNVSYSSYDEKVPLLNDQHGTISQQPVQTSTATNIAATQQDLRSSPDHILTSDNLQQQQREQETFSQQQQQQSSPQDNEPNQVVSPPSQPPVQLAEDDTLSTSVQETDSVPPAAPSPAPSASLPQSKPAPWAALAEEKRKPTGSLREIVEKEAKEADRIEAQKAAERQAAMAAEREALEQQRRALGKSASSILSPPTTMSPGSAWGGNSAFVPTKTLKDIQDEEGRKKASQGPTSLSAGPGTTVPTTSRGYASQVGSKPFSHSTSSPGVNVAPPTGTSTNTSTSSANVNSAWSTVGANGKTVAPPSAASVVGAPNSNTPGIARAKPPTTSTPPRPPIQSIQRTPSTGVPTSVPGSAVRQQSSSPKPDPDAPSPEFLQWCRESLKGLKINIDEFIQMLLSFPVNPDASVLEIISDSVYANSSTLNGRRFANEFVSRRKADVNKNKQQESPSSKAPSSMADVIRSQPKPQNDFNFTVVTKTKKKPSAR